MIKIEVPNGRFKIVLSSKKILKIGKINPKLSSQLLNALSPEVLAQTGAFLDTLFMLSIPVGTVMFTSLTLWHVKISWFIFSILSLVALILILTTHKRKQKNEAI